MELDTESRLAKITILRDLKPEDLKQVYHFANEKFFPKNTVIVNEGAYADAFYFILEGSASVYHEVAKGKAVTLATLSADDYFGEQGYLNNMVRTSSVKATTDIRLLEFSYDILKFVIEKSPQFTELLKQQSQGNLIANLQTQLNNINDYPKRELAVRSKNATTHTLQEGEIIFQRNDKAKAVYFIASGSVSLEFDAPNQRTDTLTINSHHLFGEVDIINHKPRSMTAKARTITTLISIPDTDFINAFNQTIGLKTLINLYERVYSLPHQEKIIEQFISGTGDDEVIFTKFQLNNYLTAITASAINHHASIMTVPGKTPDKTFHYSTNTGNNLDVSIDTGRIINIAASGKWPQLHRLSELLLNETFFNDVTEKTFLPYLNPVYKKSSAT